MPIRMLIGAVICGLGTFLAATFIQMYGASLIVLTRVTMMWLLITVIGVNVYRGINLGGFFRNLKKAVWKMGEYSFMLAAIFFVAGALFIFTEGPSLINLFYGVGGFIALFLGLKKRWPEKGGEK